MVIWVIKIFLYCSSVYSCHLFLISSASVKSIPPVIYCAHLCMKCSFGISYFFEEISNIFHSIVFLKLLYLSLRKAFLSLPAILWNSAFKWVYLSLSSFRFASLLFSAICMPAHTPFCLFVFLFLGDGLDHCLL